jgi:hypothetical protein
MDRAFKQRDSPCFVDGHRLHTSACCL